MKKALIPLCICFMLFGCKPGTKPVVLKEKVKIEESKKPVAQTNNCAYDNDVATLGIGLVMATDTMDLYNDSLLTNRFVKLSMYGDNMNNAPLCPKFYKPDYGIMHFICIDSSKIAYKVLNGNADVKYLPRAKGYAFKPWEVYLQNTVGIRPKDGQRVKTQPGGKSIVILPKEIDTFCPLKIRGDWMQVKYDCFYNAKNNPHEADHCNTYINQCKDPASGWIKWRDRNKLLIDIFLLE